MSGDLSTSVGVDVFWFAGMSCDGCSIAATGGGSPGLERLQRGAVPGLPPITLHHPLFAMESGAAFLESHRRALTGELERPYLLILEGSATDEALAGAGYWAALGTGGLHPGAEYVVEGVQQPTATMEWVKALAPRAEAAIALGTCAAWGGVPAAHGNVTGAMSLADLLGCGYRSALGLPVINLPGCAPNGDNIMETLAALLLFRRGVGPVPEFDELGRPAWLFSETAHRSCARAGYYEEGAFAAEPGERECLVELGCWGAVVECNMSSRGAINGHGGCMSTGGACIGCTMPGFPDQFTPFYQTVISSAMTALEPRHDGIRRLPALGSPAPATRSREGSPLPASAGGRASAPDATLPGGPAPLPRSPGAWASRPAARPGEAARGVAFYDRWRLLAGVEHE